MDIDIKNLFENSTFNSIKSSLSRDGELKKRIIFLSSFLPKWVNFSQRLFHLYNELYEIPNCVVCNIKICTFLGFYKGYSSFCGKSCTGKHNMLIAQKTSNTKITKIKKMKTLKDIYGVENIFQTDFVKEKIKEKIIDTDKKRRETNFKKYDYEIPSKNEVIKAKIKQTNLEKYGIDSLLSLEKIRNLGKEKLNTNETKEKRKKTNLNKYGVEYISQNINIKDKIKQTNFKKYGVFYPFAPTKQYNYNKLFGENGKYNYIITPLFAKEDYFGGNREIIYSFICNSCKNIFKDHTDDGHIPRCTFCFPYEKTFKFEESFNSWLTSLGIIYHRRDRKQINPLEIDFYFKNKRLGIEFNELGSHSEIRNGKQFNYHLNKTERCLEKDIQLLHIFQDEWVFKQNIVKSIIKTKLGLNNRIFARKTEFKEVNIPEGKKFFEHNHLQGMNQNINKCFGLFYDNELVQLIGLGKPRYNKNYNYEIIRSCTKLDTIVIGGFTKIMSNLTLKGSFISYVDRRYFNGNSYKDWLFIGKTQPNYFYMNKQYKNRISRIKFQKHKLSKLFPNFYCETLTEWEIMQLASYDRIWDCGNLVFSKNLY